MDPIIEDNLSDSTDAALATESSSSRKSLSRVPSVQSTSSITVTSSIGRKKPSDNKLFRREQLLEEIPIPVLTFGTKLPTLPTLSPPPPPVSNSSKQVLHRVASVRKPQSVIPVIPEESSTPPPSDHEKKKDDLDTKHHTKQSPNSGHKPARIKEEIVSPSKIALSALPIIEFDEEKIKEDARRLVQSLMQKNPRPAPGSLGEFNSGESSKSVRMSLLPIAEKIDEEPQLKLQLNVKIPVTTLPTKSDGDGAAGDGTDGESKRVVVHRKKIDTPPSLPQPLNVSSTSTPQGSNGTSNQPAFDNTPAEMVNKGPELQRPAGISHAVLRRTPSKLNVHSMVSSSSSPITPNTPSIAAAAENMFRSSKRPTTNNDANITGSVANRGGETPITPITPLTPHSFAVSSSSVASPPMSSPLFTLSPSPIKESHQSDNNSNGEDDHHQPRISSSIKTKAKSSYAMLGGGSSGSSVNSGDAPRAATPSSPQQEGGDPVTSSNRLPTAPSSSNIAAVAARFQQTSAKPTTSPFKVSTSALPRRSSWASPQDSQPKGLQIPQLKHVVPQQKTNNNDQSNVNLPMLNHVQLPQNSSVNFDPREFERTVNFYFKLNADRGDANAQYYVAYCYLHGIAIEKSRTLAIKFYQLAAQQGHVEAITALKYLEEKGDLDEDYSGLKTPRVLQRAMAAHTSNINNNNNSAPNVSSSSASVCDNASVGSHDSDKQPTQQENGERDSGGQLYSTIRQKLRRRSLNQLVPEEASSQPSSQSSSTEYDQEKRKQSSPSKVHAASDPCIQLSPRKLDTNPPPASPAANTNEKKSFAPNLRINTSLPPASRSQPNTATTGPNKSGGIASTNAFEEVKESTPIEVEPQHQSTNLSDDSRHQSEKSGEGDDGPKNFIKLNADNGDAHAQFFIAYCYLNGISVPTNKEEAMKYYRLAANQGHSGAIDALKKLFERDMMTLTPNAKRSASMDNAADQLINGMKSMSFEENAQLVRTLSRSNMRMLSRSLSNSNILLSSATSKSNNDGPGIQVGGADPACNISACGSAAWFTTRIEEEKKKIEQELHHYRVSNSLIKNKRNNASSGMLASKVKRKPFKLEYDEAMPGAAPVARPETPREVKEAEIQNVACPPTHGEKALRNKRRHSHVHPTSSSPIPKSSSSVISANSATSNGGDSTVMTYDEQQFANLVGGQGSVHGSGKDDESVASRPASVSGPTSGKSNSSSDIRHLMKAEDNGSMSHEYKIAADGGDANAQYVMGHCYEQGISVTANLHEAAKYYEMAVKQGHTLATYALGVCYQTGRGVPQDHGKAIHHFQLAAVHHHAEAEYALADYFYDGDVIRRDFELAQSLFQLSADQGLALAQFRLANMLLMSTTNAMDEGEIAKKGNNSKQTDEEKENEAVRYYQLAAGQGLDLAQNSLGYCYQYGIGVTKNDSEAMKYYILAATQGNVDGQYNLGYCYDHGIGTETNHQKALECYQIAADYGHASAQYILGVCLHKGIGIERNDVTAVKYFEQAAGQGNVHAMCALGICHQFGFGTDVNAVMALTYYRLAISEGNHPDAKQYYDDLMAMQSNGGHEFLNGGTNAAVLALGAVSNNSSFVAGPPSRNNSQTFTPLNDSWSSLDDELSVISDITFLDDDGGYISN